MFNHKLIIDFSTSKKMPAVNYYMKDLVRQAVKYTLEYEGFSNPANISVTFCDNEYIKKLNKEYRGKDTHTDVLSFPMYDFYLEEDLTFSKNETVALGDVVISLERATEQASELGNSLQREVAFLTVHSILHLLGYDHERGEEDDEAQCRAQKEIMISVDEHFTDTIRGMAYYI